MKPIFIRLWSILILSTAFSCGDKDGLTPVLANTEKVGDEITFEVSTQKSRSHYLEDDRLQIDWDLNDEIYIYSPDVNTDTNGDDYENASKRSTYYISGEGGDYTTHATIATKDGFPKLRWGRGNWQNYWSDASSTDPNSSSLEDSKKIYKWHRFFAAFPDERVEKDYDMAVKSITRGGDAILAMKYMTNQMVEFTDDNVKDTGVAKTYYGSCDMRNAYMMATKEIQYDADHVLLDFDPIMTTLSIKITSGGYEIPTGFLMNTRITGVSIIMDNYLKEGYIRYNMKNGTAHINTNTENRVEGAGVLANELTSGQESVFVGIKHNDDYFIDLGESESIELMMFLPPIPQAQTKNFKLKVHVAGNYNYVMSLFKTTTGSDGSSVYVGDLQGAATEGLLQQSRIEITLPKVNPFDNTVSQNKGNNWMSQLEESRFLWSLSIPGYTFASGTYGNESVTVDSIKKEIEVAYNMGYRAFDVTNISKNSSNNHLKGCVKNNDPIMVQLQSFDEPILIYYNDNHGIGWYSTSTIFYEYEIGNDYSNKGLIKKFTRFEFTTKLNTSSHPVYLLYKNGDYNLRNNSSRSNQDEDKLGAAGFGIEYIGSGNRSLNISNGLNFSTNYWSVYYVDNDEEARNILEWLAGTEEQKQGGTYNGTPLPLGFGMIFIRNPRTQAGRQLLQAIIDTNFKLHGTR